MKTTRLSVSLAVIFATSVTGSLNSQELSHIEGLGSLRVDEEEESIGIDQSEHRESAYTS